MHKFMYYFMLNRMLNKNINIARIRLFKDKNMLN